ncbi:MAG: hypothetical protein KME45_10665 [Stenomitos rutilans HA7619-LM2]|nr:hypothetical protein [Stenomitos rutilans HA7619-LM2]
MVLFAHVFRANRAADDKPNALRLSIATKAKVKRRKLARSGNARSLEAKQAEDYDPEWQAGWVPFGLLNTHNDQLSLDLGQSAETSDFMVDCLTAGWREHPLDSPQLDEWVVDRDSGRATRRHHRQTLRACPLPRPHHRVGTAGVYGDLLEDGG